MMLFLENWLARAGEEIALAGYWPFLAEEGLHSISKSSNCVNISLWIRSFTSF
jgi:hypothetical protein